MTNMEKKLKLDEACSTAQQFTKLYYESFDKRRNVLSKFYMDTAVLVWNGTSVTGSAEIQKFLEQLPSSEHNITCLDAQPIMEQVIQNQSTVLITTGGFVRFDKKPLPFSQNFIVTAQEGKWKVVSDTLRFQQVVQS